MGVPGLWERLEQCSSGECSLADMAWSTYRPHKRPADSLLKVGIDASIWLVQAATVALPQPHHSLLILLHKLTKLLPLPLRLLFVFDGPGRPAFKRGKRRVGKGRAIGEERRFREMIEALGFEAWTAPGEAEAELGHLSSINAIDLVISEDVDSLLFKTRRLLLRTKDEATKADPLRFKIVYRERLEETLGVDERALILVALLSGGDYDETGLMRCGPIVSFALARAGFGAELVDAYRSLDRITFVADFLPDFRAKLAGTLRENPDNLLGRRFGKLADELEGSSAFPSLEALDYYVHPLTSSSSTSTGGHWPGFQSLSALSSRPDLGQLARLLERWMEWDAQEVLDKLRRTVWEGASRRALMEELVRPGAWEDRRLRVLHPATMPAELLAPAVVVVGRTKTTHLTLTSPSSSQAVSDGPSTVNGRMTAFFSASKGPSATRMVVGSSSSSNSKKLSATPAVGDKSAPDLPRPANVVVDMIAAAAAGTAPFASSLSEPDSHPLVTSITRYRRSGADAKTDYRLVFDPWLFVAEVRAAGLREVTVSGKTATGARSDAGLDEDDDDKTEEDEEDEDEATSDSHASSSQTTSSSQQQRPAKKKKKPTSQGPLDPVLFWTPFKLVKYTHPTLCAAFERLVEEKLVREAEKTQRKAERANGVVRSRVLPKGKPAAAAVGAGKCKGKGKEVDQGFGLDYDDDDDHGNPYAAKVAANLAGRSRSAVGPAVGQSIAAGSVLSSASEDDLSDLLPREAVAATVARPRSRPMKRPPAYVELSDPSDSDESDLLSPSANRDASLTPRQTATAGPTRLRAADEPTTAPTATFKRPTRRRAVSDSPVGSAVAAGDRVASDSTSASSANPSPKKKASPPSRRPSLSPAPPAQRKQKAVLWDDSSEDDDDVDFPADPLADYKLRQHQKRQADSSAPCRPPRANATERPVARSQAAEAAAVATTAMLPSCFSSAKPRSKGSAAANPAVDIIELDASPPSSNLRRRSIDLSATPTVKAAARPLKPRVPTVLSTSSGDLTRKGSNPWSKARRTPTGSVPPSSSAGEYEVIDLTED